MSRADQTAPSAPDSVLAGGGDMGARMRAYDWSRTSLGPVEQWPQSLKTTVRIMLTSRQPMWVWWGEEMINLYNDAYRPILGGKHPLALGQPAQQVWREIWGQLGPRAEGALRHNEGTYDEALLLIMERNGYPEETYYTFSYSPVPNDQGGTGGILCANADATQHVIGERQLALLRELAARTVDARTLDEACALSVRCCETNPHDLPFAMIYLVHERHAMLVGEGRSIERGHPAAPIEVALDGGVWPFADALATNQIQLVKDIGALFGQLPMGAWDQPPQQAAVVPIALAGSAGKAAILVAGLNPFRLFDDSYHGFIELMAAQIAASLANAQAYEEERQRAEALAELDRAKTVFFSNISHEFRTPLTLMLGPAEDALADPSTLPENRERMVMIQHNAQRLLKLVNTLLDFSRIEAGRIEAIYQPTDLAALTAELASVFRSAIERASLRLIVSCPPLPEAIYIDPEMWEKIVFNLLSNAFKFTFVGKIEIGIRPLDAQVELFVRDTGTGIPAKDLPHLFERFHRVADARGRSIEGTGIGLALVQELARLHGGDVRVASEVDRGSTFTVTLPTGSAHLPADRIGGPRSYASTTLRGEVYVEEMLRWLPEPLIRDQGSRIEGAAISDQLSLAAEQPLAVSYAQSADSRPLVLLADDNADMREYVRRLLSPQYSIEAVADGAAALAAARSQVPDLVLTDIMMPQLDGFGLMRALRADARTVDVPVILLSARAGEEARVVALAAGADDYLVKPFSARELLARVGARLEMVRLRRESTRALRESEARLRASEQALRANEERLQALYVQEQAARQQAEEASRLKDDFLATVSHELRTPLTSVLGYSQMLQTRKRDEAYIARTIEKIVRSAKVQAQLIDDLLDVSRIVTGKLRIEPRALDLIMVIEAALDAVRPALEAKTIDLKMELDGALGPIIGDPDRLQQVIWNLLSNAVKFTPPSGTVAVGLQPKGGYAQITVIDTGQGISPDFLPYVFDRFRQAESASSRTFGGLGLGLSIVRHLVEMHGGTVQAHSAGLGLGATFTISLPLVAGDGHHQAEGSAAGELGAELDCPPELRGARVLLVDDQLDILDLLYDVLAPCGAVVNMCDTAQAALATLQSWRPDVLLSDVAMPGDDGYWLIRNVRALPPEEGGDTPAVALTAYVRAEDRMQVLAAGFQLYLPKPVDPAELLNVIARAIRMRANGDA